MKRLAILTTLAAAFSLFAAFLAADEKTATKDDKAPDLFARINAAKLEDKPFTLIVRLKVKPGMEAKMEGAARKAEKATRSEKGNLAYEFHRDVDNKGEYVLFERWKNVAALQAHFKEDHTKTILALFAEIAVGAPEIRLLAPVGEEN